MASPHRPPPAIHRSLRKLGQDIREARLRRHLPMAIIAERASTSRQTLARVEKGDPSVSMGIYASALHALGLLDGLGKLADPLNDPVGQALASAELPKRARIQVRRESETENDQL